MILKYLQHVKFYEHYFGLPALQHAVKHLGIALEDITDITGFQRVPTHLPYEIIRNGMVSILVSATPIGFAGQSIEGYVRTPGVECRVPRQYQSPIHIKLIRYLMDQTNPALSGTPFKIYPPGYGDLESYEIYLPTCGGASIYCPLRCLLMNDWQGIVDRHTTYFQDYYKHRQEHLYAALGLLNSEEALELKRILTHD